jgi:hypothetical protein
MYGYVLRIDDNAFCVYATRRRENAFDEERRAGNDVGGRAHQDRRSVGKENHDRFAGGFEVGIAGV